MNFQLTSDFAGFLFCLHHNLLLTAQSRKASDCRFKSRVSNSGKFACPGVDNSIWGSLVLLIGQIGVSCLVGLLASAFVLHLMF